VAAHVAAWEADLLIRRTAREIVALQPGTVPAGWRRWANAVVAPLIDWTHELRSAVRRSLDLVSGAVDYSYRRPSRRQSATSPVVLPSLVRPVPVVAVVVDTSGSVDGDLLARALAEVSGVLIAARGARSGTSVLCCDAAVHTTRRVWTAGQVDVLGGGGTDMRSGLHAATALRPRPAVVVVLTDGLTPWPAIAPTSSVVVGLLAPTERAVEAVPAWARTVRIG
jgi:predicted metal-dependent peptidase